MTVGELLEAMHELCEIEINIRENGDGRFKYMYVIGDHVQTYSGYGYSWAKNVEPGEIKKFEHPEPATFMAFNPHDMPEELKGLRICDMRISNSILSWKYRNYEYKGRKMGGWECKAYINAYPEGWMEPEEESKKYHADLKNQMSISDYLGDMI